MNDEPRINELLEAYRPQVDDLADDAWQTLRAPLIGESEVRESEVSESEVQRRAESIRRRDQIIRSAMHDVPIPAGLAERLLASLPGGDPANLLSTAPAMSSEAVSLPPQPATRVGRRAWAAAAIGVAAVVALTIGLWPKLPTDGGQVSAEELAGMVAGWENDPALGSEGAWSVLSGQGLSSHRINPSDLRVPATRVIGPVPRNDGLLLAVYELAGPGGKTARLYVARTNRTFGVPSVPQSLLHGLTGQRRGIAWQRNQYLYVIVVDSQAASPQEFVQLREIT
jgi:hypothetical protein